MLLALEGTDGAGKTLQCTRLRDFFEARGERCHVLREPGGTKLGEKLRELLLDSSERAKDAMLEALLFSASRRQLVLESVLPALERGEHVILDRSFLSTFVYQGTALAGDAGLDLDFLLDLTRRVHREAWPDRIYVLTLDQEAARRRREERGTASDAFEERGEGFLERVRLAFADFEQRLPDLVRCIDASGTADEVTAKLTQDLEAVLMRNRSAQ